MDNFYGSYGTSNAVKIILLSPPSSNYKGLISAYSRRDSFSITYTYLPTLLLTHHTILLEASQRIWGASKNSGSKKEID